MEKFEIEPKLKKEINEEGWEKEDEESGAAVIIGKKEEMPQLLEKLEKEGRAKNLGSYIKMHKEIALPKEEMSEELKEKIKRGLTFLSYGGNFIRYVDKDGNIADVEIDAEKISSIDIQSGKELQERVGDELEKFGFLLPGKTGSVSTLEAEKIFKEIWKETQNYKEKIEEQIRQKKAKEFDF